ncbi:MAG: hypothetical protein IKP88_21280 [Lachnospiraceae bacterium]|nr:hypothetical protein [Lachnospiraceae bacterium]
MKRILKNTMILFLTIVMFSGLLECIQVKAKEISLAVPKIKVKAVNSGTGIKITISKTKNAEGYEVYVSGKAISYVDYRNVDSFQKIAEVQKDGKAKRTITINSLPSGNYKIKIRSYNSKTYGTMKYSDFCKEKSVKIKKVVNGYNSSYDFSTAQKGDIIKFGAYEQDGDFTNGREPIEWIVLEKNKKQIFLVSKYALDTVPYNKDLVESLTWENCTLRKWLNEMFYVNAFNDAEKKMIKTTKVENYDNAVYGTPGGNDTKDKVFLLSQLDSINPDYGFSEEYDPLEHDVNRLCVPTAYAIMQGVYTDKNILIFLNHAIEESSCDWWLRTPGGSNWNEKGLACYVDMLARVGSAYVNNDTNGVCNSSKGVRPALCISLKSE